KDGSEIRKSKKYEIISKGVQRILVINKCVFDDEAEYECDARTAKTSGVLTVIGEFWLLFVPSPRPWPILHNEPSTYLFQRPLPVPGTAPVTHIYLLPVLYTNVWSMLDYDKYQHLLSALPTRLLNPNSRTSSFAEEEAVFTKNLSNVEGTETDSIKLICEVSKASAEVVWYKGDKELPEGGRFEYVMNGKVLPHLLCPLFIARPQNQEVLEGDKAEFVCSVSKEAFEVKWFKGSEELEIGDKYNIISDGKRRVKHTLIVRDCGLADEGEYTVIAGQDKSTAELIITEAPTDFTAHLQDQTVTEFEDAVFTCQLSKEKASVKWYKNGREIREGKVHRLQVCDIKPRDQGEYKIIAKDKDAKAKLDYENFTNLFHFGFICLKTESPEIMLDVKLLAGLTVKAGTKIELPATVKGKPEPKITWTKADLLLKADDRIKIESKPGQSTVTIADTKRGDSGPYIIEAVNSSGRATAKVDVNILDKPGPPAAFDITDITNESCFLTWNPPRDDGGSKVTNYIVERRAADSEVWHKLSSTIKETTYKAVNLTPLKEYIFRVFAENMYGIGEPAQHTPIVDVAKTSAFLNWTKPEHDGGAKIESYVIELLKSGTEDWVRVADGVPTTEHFLKGLMEKQEYSFRVRAINKAGESDPSEPSDPVLCKERLSKSLYLCQPQADYMSLRWSCSLDPPSPPRWLEVVNITKNTADLKWTPPERDGGSPITNYIVEKRDVRRKGWQVVDTTVKETTYTVTPLSEGSLYVFRVAAENAVGQSEYCELEDSYHSECAIFYLSSEKLSLPIPYRAVPTPKVAWHKDGKELKANDRVMLTSDHTAAHIEIGNCVHADAGHYTVTLENKLGSTTGTVNVKVIGK
uniref:Titin n=1 Tax=Erpetoichthys calabaricus TaxID=27687 RepID=A0A8C4S3V2_ERPCA